MLAARLTSRRFAEDRKSVIKWCTENPTRLTASNVAALESLRTIDPAENVAAFITDSCYADIDKDRVYTAMFDPSCPGEVVETSARLLFSVFWRRLPMQGLEHGHHQLVVFDFPNGLPSLVERLPPCDTSTVDSGSWLGLCDIENWKAICEYRAAA